jgi:hypothetical protein
MNQIPLLRPGEPGYLSPEDFQAIHDTPQSLRAAYLADVISVAEFERRLGACLLGPA